MKRLLNLLVFFIIISYVGNAFAAWSVNWSNAWSKKSRQWDGINVHAERISNVINDENIHLNIFANKNDGTAAMEERIVGEDKQHYSIDWIPDNVGIRDYKAHVNICQIKPVNDFNPARFKYMQEINIYIQSDLRTSRALGKCEPLWEGSLVGKMSMEGVFALNCQVHEKLPTIGGSIWRLEVGKFYVGGRNNSASAHTVVAKYTTPCTI